MRVAIVGAGSMGEWFASVTDGWLDPLFIDVDRERAEQLATRYAGEAGGPADLPDVPVVCTAVPIPKTGDVLADLAPRAQRAVVDLSGTMAGPVATMREHAGGCERISLHALFAPEHAPGNVAVVAEDADEVWDGLRHRLEAAGNRVFETEADTHDRAMETVQAKVHAAVVAFALAAEPIDERFHTPISTDLVDLATTVLSGSAHVYADIQESFDGANEVAAAAEELARADRDGFEVLYREAARDILPDDVE